jgi:hypothetical protein
MSDLQTIASPTHERVNSWSPLARCVGWLLLVCWVALLFGAIVLGERASTLAELRSAVAAGEVRAVQVAGGFPDKAGHTGYAQLDLHWREGHQGRFVEVREARPLSASDDESDLQVVKAGEVDRLLASQPGLRVEQVETNESGFTVSGVRMPSWMVWAGFCLGMATLGLLIEGPEPWRATRWAWFWAFGIPAPIGVLAYLVLGGPTGLSRQPRPGADRLTGGWSYLLCAVVSAILSATVAAAVR